ncbi:RNA polymerase sigma factor [Leptospira stimsonii]|uniref:RNA polymerase subunit sigma-70 n=1 Tax=Leptospira stimsonii TaxID=2202203 RepID=A0A396YRE6_9LEPT|nr:sigma-70 family RNA polymerase sigma factor [Leptospira stimsonii]RHX83968.1 hypothetical protein DLM75_23430 [Leptospira stimsonii]
MTDADSNSPGNKTQEAIRLIYGISKKDPRALEKFYDLFGNLIYSIIHKILMQKEESEEILQEVFTILWNKAEQFDSGRSSPLTWVTTIARNAAISKVRSKDFKNRIRTSEFQEAQSPSASVQDTAFQEVFDSSLRIRIQEGIAKLSPEIAILLREAYWSGLSQSELAEKFQLPLGTVKSRIRTGLTQLRDELKGWNL